MRYAVDLSADRVNHVPASGQGMPRSVKAGVLQKIDKSKLTGLGNLDPELIKIVEGYDPGNQYNVPYMWGSVGIVPREATPALPAMC